MFREPTNGEIRIPLMQGLVPPSPFRCMNCSFPLGQHYQGIWCPGEEMHLVILPKVPHPPCNCKDSFGKPLHPGQYHEIDCYMRNSTMEEPSETPLPIPVSLFE